MASFKRSDIREILGEAYTDDIATKLVTLHLSVVDPLKDDLASANRSAEKYKAEADKVPGLQKELDGFKNGEDWKAKYEKEHSAFEDYKGQVAKDAEVAKVKAAYKKLLTEEKISEKTLEAIMNATDYSKMKLKEDGTLDGIEDLKTDIDTKWGGFKVTTRQRGERVDNPPRGNDGNNDGPDTSVRDRLAAMHARRYGQLPTNTEKKGE